MARDDVPRACSTKSKEESDYWVRMDDDDEFLSGWVVDMAVVWRPLLLELGVKRDVIHGEHKDHEAL